MRIGLGAIKAPASYETSFIACRLPRTDRSFELYSREVSSHTHRNVDRARVVGSCIRNSGKLQQGPVRSERHSDKYPGAHYHGKPKNCRTGTGAFGKGSSHKQRRHPGKSHPPKISGTDRRRPGRRGVLGKAAIASANDSKLSVEKESLRWTEGPIHGSRSPTTAASRRRSENRRFPFRRTRPTATKRAIQTSRAPTPRASCRTGSAWLIGRLQTFRNAINAGTFAAFENVITGGPRTQNGPLGGDRFLPGRVRLCAARERAFAGQSNQARSWSHPRRPSRARPTGRNWSSFTGRSLLRDVAFTDYASNPIAVQAANELTPMPSYAGPRNGVWQRNAGPAVPRALPWRNRWALHVSVALHPDLPWCAAD